MPGGKGASQVGTQTTTSVDPRAQAQAPFLQDVWSSAQNTYRNNSQQPYPGQTLTDWGRPEQIAGQWDLYRAGDAANNIQGAALDPYNAATSGQYGVGYSPAYGGLQSIAGGLTPGQQQAMQYGNLIGGTAAGIPGTVAPYQSQLGFNAQNAGNNPAAGLLQQQASGAYLNSNPYLDQMYGNAADAVTRAYQTATSPRTDSAFENAGRYGSPSLGNATSQNERNLGQSLSGLASDVYGKNFANERSLQNAATQTLGSQYLQALGQSTSAAQAGGQLGLGAADAQRLGYSAAGSLGLANTTTQQAGLNALQSGFQGGNAQALTGASMAPSLISSSFLGPQAKIQGGTGLEGIDQKYIADQIQRYNQLQAAPWTNLSNYSALVGQPTGKLETNQQPIYGSPLGQTIGALGAGSNLLFGNQSGGLLGTLGGLGGAGTAGSVLSGIGSGALPAVISPEIGAAGLSALGAMNAGIPAIAAAAAPAAWIVCTELTRQGRMPKRHWAAGLPVFAAYPERTKQGYYYWAIPTVRHLRKYPNSRFSKFIGAISRWRAENIAAHRGVRGARKLWRGTMVTAIGYPICALLGHFVAAQDWQKETA